MLDPISRAVADLAYKEQEIARLQAEADRLRVFIEMYHSYAGNPELESDARSGARSKKDMITESAITAIRRRKAPVPLSVLYKEIEENGVEIGTSEPKQYLSTTLNRDSRFKSIRGAGWVLAE